MRHNYKNNKFKQKKHFSKSFFSHYETKTVLPFLWFVWSFCSILIRDIIYIFIIVSSVDIYQN